MIVAAAVDRTPGYERTLIYRAVDFFNDAGLPTALG